MINHLGPGGEAHPGEKRACPMCKHAGGSLGRPELRGRRWKGIAAAVRRRDRNTCQHADGSCKGTLSVHHIRRGGPDVADNLVTLCRKHHEQAEKACAAAPLAREPYAEISIG